MIHVGSVLQLHKLSRPTLRVHKTPATQKSAARPTTLACIFTNPLRLSNRRRRQTRNHHRSLPGCPNCQPRPTTVACATLPGCPNCQSRPTKAYQGEEQVSVQHDRQDVAMEYNGAITHGSQDTLVHYDWKRFQEEHSSYDTPSQAQ